MQKKETINKASTKEWVGLAILALPCMLYSMDLTILNLAVPKLSADLKPSSTQLLWIVDIYGFLLAGFMITMGSLGDKMGRRKILLIGAAVFGLASVLAAFSNSANALILSRGILGVAGATLAPSTLSLIRNMFEDPKQRIVAIGIWITSFSTGGAIGPVIGGIILEYYWWGAVFLVSIPVMVLLLILGPLLLPEYKNPEAGRIDLLSALMSLAAILSLVYGLKSTFQDGLGGLTIGFIIIGLIIGTLFIQRQKKLDHPFIDLNFFKDRRFTTALILHLLTAFALFGMFFFIAQYFQLVLGLSAFEAGLWGLPSGVSFIIGSLATTALVKRYKAEELMATGFGVAAVGFGCLMFLGSSMDLVLLVISQALFSLGISAIFTLITDVVVESVPPERAGLAASMSESSFELGGALGIAILGSIGAVLYRNGILNSAFHLQVDLADTLGGAMLSANELSAHQAASFLSIARQSFTVGVHWAAAIAVFISIGLAFSCVIIRNRK